MNHTPMWIVGLVDAARATTARDNLPAYDHFRLAVEDSMREHEDTPFAELAAEVALSLGMVK